MLLATANVVESAQIFPKLPYFAKICSKTISLKNFEISPEIGKKKIKKKNFYM
jgi:hypothetical protein